MRRFSSDFSQFLRCENGATAIEYGLIAALIGLGIITGASAVTTSINDMFSGVDGDISVAFEEDD